MVLNYEDDTTRAMADRANGTVLFFSLHHKIKEGVSMEGDAFIIEENGKKQIVCTLDDVNLLGDHNYENILAAIAVTYSMGVPVSYIKEGIKRFKGVEHRIEYVDTVKGVAYYNDSKGTNPDAAIKGIKAMNRPTWLIGGGYDKKSTYDEWIEAFDGKVKELILMGVTAPKIADCAKHMDLIRSSLLILWKKQFHTLQEKPKMEKQFYYHLHVQAGECSQIMKSGEISSKIVSEN